MPLHDLLRAHCLPAARGGHGLLQAMAQHRQGGDAQGVALQAVHRPGRPGLREEVRQVVDLHRRVRRGREEEAVGAEQLRDLPEVRRPTAQQAARARQPTVDSARGGAPEAQRGILQGGRRDLGFYDLSWANRLRSSSMGALRSET